MISRRQCTSSFLSWFALFCVLRVAVSHPKTGDGGGREVTTVFPEMPQGDMNAPRQMLSPQDPCHAFVDVDLEKQEFFSPAYPAQIYPNHTDCVLVLEAPEGHLIKLDFRDWFELEPSQDCRNDYLEVRDGAHGYNNLMMQPFCGFDFPPMLTSSDRHLWIHFRSDENIEYRGFKAVYEFVPRPTSSSTPPEVRPCIIPVGGDEGFPKKSDISNETLAFNERYKLPIDCIWVITVKEGWRIQLSFKLFSLARPNDCDSNFVDVFSDRTDIPSRDKNFCGSIADTVSSKNNIMFIRFFAEPRASAKSTFEALFTAYRENDKSNSECAADEFNCEDATCISIDLKCNGRFNCRFRWDEDDCDNNKAMPLSENHIIIIMVIFSLILSGMCCTFLFNCIKKLVRDHRTIQEYVRESREQELNQLGKQQEHMEQKNKTKVSIRSRSSSTHSSDSNHFATSNALTNTSCYVPGGELLPILIRNEHSINGDVYNQRGFEVEVQTPEMCDSACQTRESLFSNNSEHSTPSHSITSKPSPPAPFSTFGYKKETKFRAEAKIEMDEEMRRPYSVQTTKSAPDVIVTH
ncbi:PREDICTED: neuropilin and tolloid-like protein 2 isoform X2 [Nicrophorus vespilloides]|uniref:Neuropilin and tolloid-like protein 2 isoform X2 n=1 Tax=Nicrophorus vespilloides TaxID=110193 RepID=A0ABM1MGB5_NICVS|nr:PREDICTED: neuropilin and tolloid-like protein 2 isoform X2 [Nicrophorus vespilloides]